MSMNKDNSHSWVRISYGLNKLVTNLNNEQETSEVQFEENASRLNAGDVASRSKAKVKPQRRDSASSSTRTIAIEERTWTDDEPGEYSISDREVSKKLIHLLHHGSLPRESEGAIEFWRIKDNLQKHFLHCHQWSDEKWKKSMARGGGGIKKKYQYCTDPSGQETLYLRALQGHSGRSLIDPWLQDNVLIPNNFFQYIYQVGCANNLHSIINSGSIPGGRNSSNRQTVLFLFVEPMDKNHQDPDHDRLGSTASCTIHAWSMEETSEYGVLGRHQICSTERSKVLSDAIERHHPSQYTPSLLYPEGYQDGNWRNHIRKSIWITSNASEDFLEIWLDERIGFRTCSTTRWRSCSSIQKFPIKPTKSKPRSCQNGDSRCLPWHQSRTRFVPFPGDRNTFFSWRSCETS